MVMVLVMVPGGDSEWHQVVMVMMMVPGGDGGTRVVMMIIVYYCSSVYVYICVLIIAYL